LDGKQVVAIRTEFFTPWIVHILQTFRLGVWLAHPFPIAPLWGLMMKVRCLRLRFSSRMWQQRALYSPGSTHV